MLCDAKLLSVLMVIREVGNKLVGLWIGHQEIVKGKTWLNQVIDDGPKSLHN